MSERSASIRMAAELGLRVEGMADIPALMGAVYGADALLLRETDLGPEFFRLGSGVAGELFQKLVTYRVVTALVLPDFTAHGERFSQLAWEHARHPAVRFVHTEEQALAWLARQVGS